jgi:hypothetical protein
VKVFSKDKERSYVRERDALIKLQRNNVQNVPRCQAEFRSRDGALVLVVTPVGEPVLPLAGGRRTTGIHLATLVDILQAAHMIGVAHRDVKPSNIFIDKDNNILLNDWGSSCTLNEEIAWQGTIGFSELCSPSGRQIPTASCDLKALVRSVYAMLFLEVPPHSAQDVLVFWDQRMRPGTMWAAAMTAASDANYSCLKQILGSIK